MLVHVDPSCSAADNHIVTTLLSDHLNLLGRQVSSIEPISAGQRSSPTDVRNALTELVNVALALFRVIEENAARRAAELGDDQWEVATRAAADDYRSWHTAASALAASLRQAKAAGIVIDLAPDLMRACNWAKIAGTDVEATISAVRSFNRGEEGIPLERLADELRGGAIARGG